MPHATASATVAERRSVTKWLLRLAAFVVAVVVVYVGVAMGWLDGYVL